MDVVSFTIDHDKLLPGVYVSRKDYIGNEVITTFDIRMKYPNVEPVLGNPAIHTIEHLLAVYLRGPESGWADQVVYIGPMGCRTGMYFIVKGDREAEEILKLVKNMFIFIKDYSGSIPATTSKECGNYLEHNLAFAKYEANKYYNDVLAKISKENMLYPE